MTKKEQAGLYRIIIIDYINDVEMYDVTFWNQSLTFELEKNLGIFLTI